MRDEQRTVDPLADSFESEEAASEFWDTHSLMDYEEQVEETDDTIEIARSPLRRAASLFLRVLAAVEVDYTSQDPFEIDLRREAYLLIRL